MILDDPFHRNGPLLVILVPGMIRPLGWVFLWWNDAVEVIEAIEAVEVTEVTEVIEAAEVLRPGKTLLRTSESSRHFNSALLLCFEKKFLGNHEISYWILAPFLLEAVEASQCYFLENWFIKLKCPTLLKPLATIIQQNYWSLYTSEPFTFTRYTMRHPVCIEKDLIGRSLLKFTWFPIEAIINLWLFLPVSELVSSASFPPNKKSKKEPSASSTLAASKKKW